MTQSKPAPPPVSEKPISGSFKDRIAAFNKPAAAPIAPFKPGGLASSGSSFIKKPFVAPPPRKDAYIPPPREQAQKIYRRDEDPEIVAREAEDLEAATKAGLISTTNADQEDQPKPTSLKERIALLQKQQLEQAQRHAEAVQKKEKPKRPQKKRTDSNEVMEYGVTEQHGDGGGSGGVGGGNGDGDGDGGNLERTSSVDHTEKRSMDNIRNDDLPLRIVPSNKRRSSREPTIPGPRELMSDTNDADQ